MFAFFFDVCDFLDDFELKQHKLDVMNYGTREKECLNCDEVGGCAIETIYYNSMQSMRCDLFVWNGSGTMRRLQSIFFFSFVYFCLIYFFRETLVTVVWIINVLAISYYNNIILK